MITERITCDVCGKLKGQVNHWFLFVGYARFEVQPWPKDNRELPNSGHVCGQECAVKALSEWMQKQSAQ